ncbi:MAG: NAD(+) diphosphatase [Rhodoplanes sp.]
MSRYPDFAGKLQIAFTGGRIEREPGRRRDAGWCAALLADAASRAYALIGDQVVLQKIEAHAEPLFTLAEAATFGAAHEQVLLGTDEGAGRFAIGLDRAVADELKRRGLLVIDLRSIAIQGLVPASHLPGLAAAKALLVWHARHRFCSVCGAPTRLAESGWRRDCTACEAQHFPRTDPVVIMLATDGDRCVLARQAHFSPGMWSCLAGFIEPGESIEEAARRETQEEVGIACGRVRYFASQPWPFPMSLMIGCHVEALSTALTVDRSELEGARWFARDEVAAMINLHHPEGLTAPPPWAIAHHIIRAWVEDAGASG